MELTHFERPVLDIEGLNSRSRNEMMQYTASRGADISEEMMFKQSAFDNSKQENSFMDHTPDAVGLSSQVPYRNETQNESSWKNSIVTFQFSLVAFILFTASFTFIGLLSAPKLTDSGDES